MIKIVNKICAIILFICAFCAFAEPSLFNINDHEVGGLLIFILAFMKEISNKIDDINERIDNLP